MGAVTIFKFLLYISPYVVLNAIPLAILLGGIMSFGGMAEKSEFTAMKSMGISLNNMMKSMSFIILFMAIGAFIFANTALPYGNYKFSNLRRNIKRKMPSVAITEGIFNDFKPAGINIHVKKKYGENNNKLEDIIIHQKVNGVPDKVIIAKRGLFRSDPENQLIQLVLYDGTFYEELERQQKKVSDRKKHPAMKSQFNEHVINIDVSSIDNVDLDKTSVSSARQMLNVIDLKREIDTLKTKRTNTVKSFSEEIIRRNLIKKTPPANYNNYKDIYALINDTVFLNKKNLLALYNKATQKADAMLLLTQRKKDNFYSQKVRINKYVHTFFEKFTYPVMVIIMFLVGIPLGAIIKKGGFGISIVFGVVIFITYYILTMLGKNAAEEGAVPPYLGAWFAVILLLPLGMFLTYKANNDREFNWISNTYQYIQKFFSKKKKIQTGN